MIKKCIIFVSIILVIALGVLVGYSYMNKNVIFKSEETNAQNVIENTVKEETEEEKMAKIIKTKIDELSLDEKIAQLFLVRFPNSNAKEIAISNNFGGYILFEKDFSNKTTEQVQNMINEIQEDVKIPFAIAVDEEGGSVVRISSNKNLAESKFKSPSALYNEGGFDLIKQDTINKGNLLGNLGINLNLAPVVDVSNKSDYMYNRTLKQGVDLTKEFAKCVIEASKETKVTFTLKHFPGYGHNVDTHKQGSLDTRTYDEIINTAIPPFEEGIKAGAEAILISHNIIECMDKDNPASISVSVHNLLRDNLNYKGLIITDDLSMNAVSSIENVYVKAVTAGNNLIITSDYEKAINQVKSAIENGSISESQIDDLVAKTIEWKFNKNLLNKEEIYD